MKKIVFIALSTLLLACTDKPHPTYVKITGQITNAKSKEITIYGRNGYKKVISIDKNGNFNDTLKLKAATNFQWMLRSDQVLSTVYFANGEDVQITADAKNYHKTLNFIGGQADLNNYKNKQYNLIITKETSFNNNWYKENRKTFQAKLKGLEESLNSLLHSFKNLNKDILSSEEAMNKRYIDSYNKKYPTEHKFALRLLKGNQSPSFENYKNYKGGTSSLSDFKGKYVFIDVWATWCGPCKAQIPFLKEFEKKYAHKNIEFVSISVDKKADFDKWKKMVKDLKLSGTQLFADKNFLSSFISKYDINNIPRFILIDPEGKIVDYKAPRPSNKKEFEKLLAVVEN